MVSVRADRVRAGWVAVIPVKRLGAAKSRLRGAVAAPRHEDLALAMLTDTLTAVLACPEVAEALVVTDDPTVTTLAAALSARTTADVPGAGLNAAVRFGADVLVGRRRGRVVLAGDLPGLRAEDLGAALRAAQGPDPAVRRFVADAAGTGTVLLAAPAGVPLDPRFGVGSAAAHAASGAVAVAGDWPGLRHDVDTPADLWTAVALGAGPRTTELLRDLGLIAGCRAG
jgi:2-phospho-L-lactate guanylyltransferase